MRRRSWRVPLLSEFFPVSKEQFIAYAFHGCL
jgi:hypothetical protein